jgi:hypothetical protein
MSARQPDLLSDHSVAELHEGQLADGEPTPHQRRSMLIAGSEDFERLETRETSAALVDRMVAEGKVKLSAPTGSPSVPDEDFDWSCDDVVLREQRKTAVYWNTVGDLVIRQERTWDENDDPFMVIAAGNVQEFLDAICDRVGIGSAGRQSSNG